MLKVIIADDHVMIREGLRRVIDESGNMTTVAEAADGGEALARIRESDCDLFVMDMSMPVMGGVELIRQIRKLRPALPILVMSMHDTGKIAASALKAGASGYVTKTTDPDQLRTVMAQIAAGGRYIDPAVANNMIFDGAYEKQPHEALTEREGQIMQMIVSGKSTKRIAAELFISPKTVSTHKMRLMEKMKIDNEADLVRYALEHQLTDPSLSRAV